MQNHRLCALFESLAESRRQEEEMQMFAPTHHAAAAGVAGVLQVAVQQFCGSILESFG